MLLKYYKLMAHKVVLLKHIYAVNFKAGTPNYNVLAEWSKIAFLVCRLGSATIFLSFFFFIPYTAVYNFFTNNRDPIIPTYLYGIDESTFSGYSSLTLYHILILAMGSFGTVCADILMTMFVVHMIPLMRILYNMFDQMNVVLRSGEMCQNSLEFDKFFRNTILVHKEISA